MATLESMLAGRNLSRMVQNVQSGLPFVLPPQFMSPTDPTVSGHTFEYPQVNGNRDLALVVSQDSPARRVGHQGVTYRSVNMLRTFESQRFNANKLRNLVQVENPQTRDQMGRSFVERNSMFFKKRQMNLVQTAAAVMLLKFSLHFNEKGELLTGSSGAITSVDPEIPAGQQSQLDILGDGDIIGASWATDATDIIGDLAEIKRQMQKLGGWTMRFAFHGKNIPGYISSNTEASEYIKQTPALATQRFEGSNIVPNGFQDLIWVNVGDMYYIDADGAAQNILGDDEVVFTPEPSEEWWRMAHGSEMVPTGIAQIGTDAQTLLGNLSEVFGPFSYARLSTNPVSVEQFAGLNFVPVIAATKAVCKADVTP